MKRINLPTLIAISIISWIMVNMLHEIAGHAGLAYLSGLKIKAVNTTTAYLEVNWDNEIATNGFWKLRLFLLGGVFLNFISGLIGYLVLRYNQSLNPQMRVFLWYFASFSYTVILMNLVSAPLTGGGDLAEIINTLENKLLAKSLVLMGGMIFMILGYILIQRAFMVKIKRSKLITLTFIPVVVIIIIQSLSLIKSPFAYLPPTENHLLASVFAFFHFVIWATIVNIIPAPGNKHDTITILPGKSTLWIISGVIIAIFYIFIRGPGIGSFECHPSL